MRLWPPLSRHSVVAPAARAPSTVRRRLLDCRVRVFHFQGRLAVTRCEPCGRGSDGSPISGTFAKARALPSTCYGIVALPVVALALASFELATWLPTLVIWCAKPWLDRTILFALSRAAFGQRTAPSDVWKAQRQVWWSQFLFTWTVRRLSLWRSLTQPVYQLEGLSIVRAGARVRQLRHRNAGSALMMTGAFSLAENALTFALVSLFFWAPVGTARDC